MLGVIGVLIAIALLVFMAYRGWGIIPASLLCSIIVVLTNKGDLWQSLSGNYINGFIYFAGNYFLIFVLGALFGQVMGESGSAKAISYKLLDWFGEKNAILVVTLATVILTYGGVNLFIVIFTVYPLALILFKAADLPKRTHCGFCWSWSGYSYNDLLTRCSFYSKPNSSSSTWDNSYSSSTDGYYLWCINLGFRSPVHTETGQKGPGNGRWFCSRS